MDLNLAAEIEAWFERLDDGEFLRVRDGYPYSVVGPTTERRVFYTTKPHCLFRHQAELPCPAFIGQGCLPNFSDLTWIQTLIGDRELVFLGDCDPPALLIYAWLRSHRPMRFLGVSDQLISRMQVTNRDHILIQLHPSESAALPLLFRALPDLEKLIGSDCLSMLRDGSKIEIEGVVSFATVDLRSVLNSV